MSRPDKRSLCQFGPSTCKTPGHGHSGSRHPSQVGMLLSRSWGAKLQGNIQLDMSYTTIPVFNQTRILYQESHMKYMVSNQEMPNNIPMYSIHSNLNSFILHTDEDIDKQVGEIETNLGTQHQPP